MLARVRTDRFPHYVLTAWWAHSDFVDTNVYACLGVTCHLHFWQNDRGLLRATAAIRGGRDTEWESAQKVNFGEENPSAAPCRDSHSQPFNHESGAPPTSSPGSPWSYRRHRLRCVLFHNCTCRTMIATILYHLANKYSFIFKTQRDTWIELTIRPLQRTDTETPVDNWDWDTCAKLRLRHLRKTDTENDAESSSETWRRNTCRVLIPNHLQKTDTETPAEKWYRIIFRKLTQKHLQRTDNETSAENLHRNTPRREAGDVWCLPPVWNLRAVIWFHFAISFLVLLPSPVTLSVLSFSVCWSFLLNFLKKILQYFSLRDRLFLYGSCLAVRRRQLVGGMYSMLPYDTSIYFYAFI